MNNTLRDELIWIWTEPDTFTQHVLARFDEGATLCGQRREWLPDERGGDPGDKPWYNDHERDDVVACEVCRSGIPPREQQLFDQEILEANGSLSPDHGTLSQSGETAG